MLNIKNNIIKKCRGCTRLPTHLSDVTPGARIWIGTLEGLLLWAAIGKLHQQRIVGSGQFGAVEHVDDLLALFTRLHSCKADTLTIIYTFSGWCVLGGSRWGDSVCVWMCAYGIFRLQENVMRIQWWPGVFDEHRRKTQHMRQIQKKTHTQPNRKCIILNRAREMNGWTWNEVD